MMCSHLFGTAVLTAGAAVMASSVATASVGYGARGWLTYSSFDINGNCQSKQSLLFDVNVLGERWRIRTEPAIETNFGIGYFVVGLSSNSVAKLTVFEEGYDPAASPLRRLRERLLGAHPDLFVVPPEVARREALLEAFHARVMEQRKEGPQRAAAQHEIKNVATATLQRSRIPRIDASQGAMLWFAFTPQASAQPGGEGMLPQLWDDGNATLRFRTAQWRVFNQFPHLVSSADYQWPGKKLLPDGSFEVLRRSGPSGLAAHYEVEAVTNFRGLVLPLTFKLGRFSAERKSLLTAVTGSVVEVRDVTPEEVADLTVPARTYVTDERFSRGAVTNRLAYLTFSNASLAAPSGRQFGSATDKLSKVGTSSAKTWVRIVLGALFLAPVLLLVLRRTLVKLKK